MKSTGIVRKVDELGRIVLPIELRRTLDIAEKDAFGDLCRWLHHSTKEVSAQLYFLRQQQRSGGLQGQKRLSPMSEGPEKQLTRKKHSPPPGGERFLCALTGRR